jgi:hypothetical protein
VNRLIGGLASFCRETPAFVLGRVISPIKPGRTDVYVAHLPGI